MAQDSVGTLQISSLHDNAFHTQAAYTATQAAAEILDTLSSGRYLITDILAAADTAGSITILEGLTGTTSKAVFTFPAGGGTAPLSPTQHIQITSTANVVVTTTMTGTSLMIAGYTM